MKNLIKEGRWLNEPCGKRIEEDSVVIKTDPGTDFWQRTFYGFRNENAHAYLVPLKENFTLSFRVSFAYKERFDQCGIAAYLDNENWIKGSIEYENESFCHLGSVVTNLGYSDWATQEIPAPDAWYYRLSRRGPDFLIESSKDGKTYSQMRVCHFHALGETTREMGHEASPDTKGKEVLVGLYACSPLDSSFEAVFDSILLEENQWAPHE